VSSQAFLEPTLPQHAERAKSGHAILVDMAGAFLDALTETEAEELRSIGRQRAYGANMTLFHHGDEAGPVVVLLSGRAKVVSLSSAGREVIVAVRGPGDLLGELSAIDGEPRSATVTTLEPVDALLIPGSAFATFLERCPRVALVILRMVAGRLRYADAQQADFATHDVVGRVAHRLVELSERFGAPTAGRIEIELPLSQEELAAWTGASREAVSKALQLLRSLRVVETGRRHITVLDPEALQRRAQ
jgi:CRP/FNR family cyclic AMP-dependent transcriptional regulator